MSFTRRQLLFLNDTHLRRDLRSPEGLVTCLDAVEKLSPKPNFIVTSGDLIQNLRDEDLKRANELADPAYPQKEVENESTN
ncbi:MAG: hypothetical protein KME38_23855 [Spirirestis rafaelensis WJT71-NPBG6]|jgi:predicted MPP superfamily phosphohydrolase|nr:hypothetical protein [Spirirestis rafaelensis WJT71-NPBG6]